MPLLGFTREDSTAAQDILVAEIRQVLTVFSGPKPRAQKAPPTNKERIASINSALRMADSWDETQLGPRTSHEQKCFDSLAARAARNMVDISKITDKGVCTSCTARISCFAATRASPGTKGAEGGLTG
jgi:hypothetical protein